MKNKVLMKNLHAWRDMVEAHFLLGEFNCENCADYAPGVLCEGKGYTTKRECLDCLREKFNDGERTYGEFYSQPHHMR